MHITDKAIKEGKATPMIIFTKEIPCGFKGVGTALGLLGLFLFRVKGKEKELKIAGQ